MSAGELLKIKALLQTYPGWVPVLMFATALLWVVCYSALAFFAPPPNLDLVDFRPTNFSDRPGVLAVEVRLANRTGNVVSLRSAQLELYSGERPTGGLASLDTLSARYTIRHATGGRGYEVSTGDLTARPVEVGRPYAGQDFFRLTVPLSQSIENQKTDRFALEIDEVTIAASSVDRIRLVLDPDKGQPLEAETRLPPRGQDVLGPNR